MRFLKALETQWFKNKQFNNKVDKRFKQPLYQRRYIDDK